LDDDVFVFVEDDMDCKLISMSGDMGGTDSAGMVDNGLPVRRLGYRGAGSLLVVAAAAVVVVIVALGR
jgi:hypothetical protein